jgi:hypothetical protein
VFATPTLPDYCSSYSSQLKGLSEELPSVTGITATLLGPLLRAVGVFFFITVEKHDPAVIEGNEYVLVTEQHFADDVINVRAESHRVGHRRMEIGNGKPELLHIGHWPTTLTHCAGK